MWEDFLITYIFTYIFLKTRGEVPETKQPLFFGSDGV